MINCEGSKCRWDLLSHSCKGGGSGCFLAVIITDMSELRTLFSHSPMEAVIALECIM